MKPTRISHLVLMGDSLSDRGTMDHRHLLGFIPMDGLSGLKAKSTRGRFTNGFTWSDDVFVDFANEFGIRQLEHRKVPQRQSELVDALLLADPALSQKPRRDDTDVADAVIDGDLEVKSVVETSYTLDNNLRFDYEGQPLARSFAEGGLTAHNYAWSFINSISLFFSRLILSTLDKKRNELLADDRARETTSAAKAKTLVVEWSGANDLITVNKRPSHDAVEKAVQARIKNVKELMRNGYKHFVLFNLPDLGLTPRYQSKGGEEQRNASECSQYFNQRLAEECSKLAYENPMHSIEVFDVSSTFSDIYNHPEDHGFDSEKQRQPYTSSDEFIRTREHTSPAPGYMFWDDVHPTAHMHALLADAFYQKYKVEYNFTQPKVEAQEKIKLSLNKTELVAAFRAAYKGKLDADKRGYFGFFRRSNMPYHSADLETILKHALYNGGHRSLQVLQELGWLDAKKNLIPDCFALEKALAVVKAEHEQQAAPLSARS